MELGELKQLVPGLADKSHNDLIKIFGWFLHIHKNKATFTGADIGQCYAALHLSAPSSFGGYLKNLFDRKDILKSGGAYKLEHKVRAAFEGKYGQSEITVKVTNALAGLADTIPDMAERDYYKEALSCYTHGSFRAAVVMTWNIAFSHLCDHVLAKRLADFNARWIISYAGHHKNKTKAIASMDDFNDELKESEVMLICRDAGIITKNIYNIMHASLGKRNAAAHPSTVIIDKLQADAYIMDLITNVVLKIV
jgi:hypothetical protein